jgi:uncharacterized membrane protein YdjX (TVP38/TMEM64 family)
MNARVLIAAVVLGLLILAAIFLPVTDGLRTALAWTARHGAIAWPVFIALYVLATVCLLPGLILTIAAGAIFGLTRGVALVSLSSVLGATAAFFIGRTFARDWISGRIQSWPRFRALDQALAIRGFWIVLLTRLSPVFPFNLLNYAYGVTAVRARDYILASWLGMLPATILYVYAGSAAASLTQALSGDVRTGTSGRVLLWVGLAATIVASGLVARLARNQLDRELAA